MSADNSRSTPPEHHCEHFSLHSPSFYESGTCEWCTAQNGTRRYQRARNSDFTHEGTLILKETVV